MHGLVRSCITLIVPPEAEMVNHTTALKGAPVHEKELALPLLFMPCKRSFVPALPLTSDYVYNILGVELLFPTPKPIEVMA